MIISASRRTDIPAFYAPWMMRRLEEGMALVPHPRNPGRMGRVLLSPEHVDCIVFWTKNPGPMLSRLPELDAVGYRYYFTFTLTAYGRDVETRLPPKDALVETFLRLSDHVGPLRVDWRYDPIILDEKHDAAWHVDAFSALCRRLHRATGRCVINFVKAYRHLAPDIREGEEAEVFKAAQGLSEVAAEHGLPLFHCAGERSLERFGVRTGACIDKEKIEAILGCSIRAKKDAGQPRACGCMESVDIGMYDSCAHGCAYCYAVTSEKRLKRNLAAHDVDSPMLCGWPTGNEILSDRTRPTNRVGQTRLW